MLNRFDWTLEGERKDLECGLKLGRQTAPKRDVSLAGGCQKGLGVGRPLKEAKKTRSVS